MVVSKTLKEHISKVIHEKLVKKMNEKAKKEREDFEKARPEIEKLFKQYTKDCRNVLKNHGLDPNDYGFDDDGIKSPLMMYRHPAQVYWRDEQDIINKAILAIELGDIPKNEVMAFIDNYEIPDKK